MPDTGTNAANMRDVHGELTSLELIRDGNWARDAVHDHALYHTVSTIAALLECGAPVGGLLVTAKILNSL